MTEKEIGWKSKIIKNQISNLLRNWKLHEVLIILVLKAFIHIANPIKHSILCIEGSSKL